MTNRELFLRYLAQTSDSPLALEIERAEGVFLYDKDGKRYFDLISGISVSNTGHRHPEVINAIKAQLDKYLHLMVYGEIIQQPQIELAETLCSILPKSLNSVYFVNSGSEAVEGALKLAKRSTGRSNIISFKNSYHGSSHGALSIMGCEEYKQAYRPLLPDISILEYNDMKSLDHITDKTAAVVVEMVQAEAGIRVPDEDFIIGLKDKCKKHGALLIADEIQTGLGRTGKMFGFEHFNILPDILLLAKGLGGGMPLGAFIADRNIMKNLSFNPALGHITTFGGHPVSCAAALASLNVILKNSLHLKSKGKAERFRENIEKCSLVKEFRSAALMMAMEMDDKIAISDFVDKCLKNGVLLDWFLFSPSSVRIAPPLTITENEIDEACRLIIKSMEECGNE